jgi:hypothetical protein
MLGDELHLRQFERQGVYSYFHIFEAILVLFPGGYLACLRGYVV